MSRRLWKLLVMLIGAAITVLARTPEACVLGLGFCLAVAAERNGA